MTESGSMERLGVLLQAASRDGAKASFGDDRFTLDFLEEETAVHFISTRENPTLIGGPAGFKATASRIVVQEGDHEWEVDLEDPVDIEISGVDLSSAREEAER